MKEYSAPAGALLEADRALAAEAGRIRLFHHVNPINEQEQKDRFLQNPSRKREPRFAYPPLAFDADAVVKAIEDAPVEAIEGEDLRELYEQKRRELVGLVRLLQLRGSEAFFAQSLSLFGRPPAETVRDAEEILGLPPEEEPRDLDSEAVRAILEEHLDRYRDRYPDFRCEIVLVPHMSSNMYVHENQIHIKRDALFSRRAAECDKHHEIDAHILTYLNGTRQPLRLLQTGPAGSLAFQESLGVFTEVASRVIFPGRMRSLAARIWAVDAMAGGEGFTGVFTMLARRFGMDADEAYAVCQRVYRAGGFTKDWLYVADLEGIFRYWASGGDMPRLLCGKGSLEALRVAGERGLLHPPKFLPPYLEGLEARRREARVQDGLPGGRIGLKTLFSCGGMPAC